MKVMGLAAAALAAKATLGPVTVLLVGDETWTGLGHFRLCRRHHRLRDSERGQCRARNRRQNEPADAAQHVHAQCILRQGNAG